MKSYSRSLYKTLRLVLACGDLKIDWETPPPSDNPAENALRKYKNWMPTQSKPGQEAAFILNLGCEKEINTIEVRNPSYKSSTKTFKVSASNSSNEGFAEVIFGEMEDSRNENKENIPLLRFHFNNTLAQYVQFYILDYYDNQGGGLNYFNVYQDLNEYIYQKSDFPSLSHEETGFMCQDVVVGMKLDDHFRVHEDISSWSLCQEKCLEDEECRAWSWGNALRCKLSKYEKRTVALTNIHQVSGLRQCKIFQQNLTEL